MGLRIRHLGLTDYRTARDLQLELVDGRLSGDPADTVLVTEHPPVFTLGRRGSRQHLSVPESFLAARGIEVVHIERGGDITYHGPGQLVVYPVVHLRSSRLSVADYVSRLEELMLRVAGSCGVRARRDPRGRGIWCDRGKIGSVGIAVRHGVAFHGLALNVNLDLLPFSWINPCGLSGVKMTSLAEVSGRPIAVADAARHLPGHLQELFGEIVSGADRERLCCLEVV